MATVISSLSSKLLRTVLTSTKPGIASTAFVRYSSDAMADIVVRLSLYMSIGQYSLVLL